MIPKVIADVSGFGDSPDKSREVEVLTVHFAKNTMRVRWTEHWGNSYGKHSKVFTKDISADPFFEKYGRRYK